jgi:hypothetical protein
MVVVEFSSYGSAFAAFMESAADQSNDAFPHVYKRQ